MMQGINRSGHETLKLVKLFNWSFETLQVAGHCQMCWVYQYQPNQEVTEVEKYFLQLKQRYKFAQR